MLTTMLLLTDDRDPRFADGSGCAVLTLLMLSLFAAVVVVVLLL